jgi:hypothetical protein
MGSGLERLARAFGRAAVRDPEGGVVGVAGYPVRIAGTYCCFGCSRQWALKPSQRFPTCQCKAGFGVWVWMERL